MAEKLPKLYDQSYREEIPVVPMVMDNSCDNSYVIMVGVDGDGNPDPNDLPVMILAKRMSCRRGRIRMAVCLRILNRQKSWKLLENFAKGRRNITLNCQAKEAALLPWRTVGFFR